jgi:hypothetical protein
MYDNESKATVNAKEQTTRDGSPSEASSARPAADAGSRPDEREVLRRRLCEEHRRHALVAELTRQGATRPQQAARLLAERVDVRLDDDLRPVLVDGDAPADLADVVGDWLRENEHYLPAPADTGSGARKGVGPGGGPSLAALDADPARKARFIAEHGPQAYLKLARRRQ